MDDERTRMAKLHYAILQHISDLGASGLQDLREQFPEVPEDEFWAEVAWVGERRRRGLAWPVRPVTAASAAQDRALGPDVRRTTAGVDGPLPTLFADIERLKAACVDEQGRVRNARGYADALKLKAQAVKLQYATLKSEMTAKRIKQYIHELATLVATFEPSLARQIRSRAKRIIGALDLDKMSEE